MAEQPPQTYANHARLDPPFHFFMIPVFTGMLLVSGWNLVRAVTLANFWNVVVALAVLVAGFKIRLYALRVQDRLIRLEERLRLATLLPEPLRSRIPELTPSQIIALRFASDAELPALVEKALAGGLPGKQIKQSIVNWRPDYFRV
jgi:hypothetical protein